MKVPDEEIADAIGAGDAFDAGMIYGFLHGWSVEKCQEFATLAAASTLNAPGGTDSLAGVKELMRRMNDEYLCP